jgi:hypothetical protein
MKNGKLNIQGNVLGNCWEKIYENILVSATTSITISGLDGNTDEEYKILVRPINGYNGNCGYYIRPNNDSGANYGYQNIYASNTSVGGGRAGGNTGFLINAADSLNRISLYNAILMAKSGYVRTLMLENVCSVNGTAILFNTFEGWSWNNTADNITSLVIIATQTDGLGIGSVIELWRKSKKV